MGADYPFRNNRRTTFHPSKSRSRSPLRRLLSLGLGLVLVVVLLGAGWMVYVTKGPGRGAGTPEVAKATTLPVPAPSEAATQPVAASPAPVAKTQEAPPPAPAVAPPPPAEPASQPLAVAPANTPISGKGLVFCYQGKVPDTRLLVVDKSRQRLMVLHYLGQMTLEYEYTCSTGMQPGNKQTAGDERTPEGIYFTTHRYEDRKITVFGDRALHLNYPNPVDQTENRDGSGIFIHGTNKALKPRASNGCVELRNEDLAIVASTINEQLTPVVVVSHLELPGLQERVQACDILEHLSIQSLDEAEAALGQELAIRGVKGVAPSASTFRELEELAPRLGGMASRNPKLHFETTGMSLIGVNDQWVVVAEQKITAPGVAGIQVTRRFYLRGPDPMHASLVMSNWVVDSQAQARQLASLAPPPPKPPVVVASAQPVAEAPAAEAAPAVPPARPAKAAEPERRPPATPNPEEQVRAMLSGWIKAWQTKNVSSYIEFYAPEFSSDGMNREAWRKHKAYLNTVYKVIGVEASDVRVNVNGSRARVMFVQHYRSDWHRDVGRKQLELVLKNGHWKITAERWEALSGRAAEGGRRGRS